jgi:hypothetical protein
MLNKKLNKFALVASIFTGMTLSSVANAHPRWILPSHFTISKADGEWLTFDVTASNGTFVMDKPAGSETAEVLMPDGHKERPDFVLRGQRRSVFDFHFSEEGTHRVQVNNVPSYVTLFKVENEKKPQRVRASKVERDAIIPKGASDVSTILNYTRAETYITVGKPSDKAFDLEGAYLELKPITRPADIVAQEPVRFQMFFEGKPQAGVKADITRDGTSYRNQPEQIEVVSDEQGFINFTPEMAGRYLLKANYRGELANNPLADKVNAEVHLTFEAMLP